ncbi:Pentatricopeptide repeat [Dillenia turbinata]|uniref:Pentatricopeptide repeat n=1 Tax=Dillenia turbinata TaxID=194707 RepID=A0AAN8WBW3_9MAGN
MATRALFFYLRRVQGNRSRFRSLTSGAVRSEIVEDKQESFAKSPEKVDDDLKSRIFRLRLPKRSATNVLQKWIGEGNSVSISDLRNISKELRKAQRYKHALEISEWMVTHDEFELSDSDYAVRIDLITKVFGIDAAERYFEGLPHTAKTTETYTVLLHSFAAAKMTDKAEDLYEQIKTLNLSFGALLYNEMMTLYMSVGQVEKVSAVVEDLKRQKIVPDLFTYNLWISSCAAALDIDGVREVLSEMSQESGSNDDWERYMKLANIYISTANLMNSDSNSVIETETGITQREWITYDFLIILYAGLGEKVKIDQIWKSLRMTKQKMTSRNYICILSSYLMLGELKGTEEVIDQWKHSTATDFDISTCKRLLDAFVGAGLKEKAQAFQAVLVQKECGPIDEIN